MSHIERARQLHAEVPVVDTLSPNWLSEMYLSPQMVEIARRLKTEGQSRQMIQRALAGHLIDNIANDGELRRGYLDWWDRAGVTAASVSLYFASPPSRAWDDLLRAIGRSDTLLEHVGDRFAKCLEPEDVSAALAARKHLIIFNVQNAEPIGDDLSRVETLHGLGVRIMQLTYNLRNHFADGCAERRDGGVSKFGVALIETLNEHRIAVDLSHCSDMTTRDAVELSKAPVAVTHSCSRELGHHPRGKPDELVRAIATRGGYFGILICPAMLTPTGRGADLDVVVDHVMHVLSVAGEDCVGIGTDWGKPYYRVMDWTGGVAERGGGGFDWVGWTPEHRFDPGEECRGMETWDLWPNLTARLLERGLNERLVAKIIGGNFLRFWRDVRGG